jgi:Tfp pilus assembly protein PilO
MGKNLSYLVIGFVLTITIVFGLGWYLTKSDNYEQMEIDTSVETLSRENFNESASQTNALNKNGDIPLMVTADQIGRENPFDEY